MEKRHEIIQFDSGSPIKLFTHKLGDVSRHWHESLELLFVLAGEVTVFTGDTQQTLGPDDMLLINSNTIHELHSEDCVLIAAQIKLSKFDLPQSLAENLHFDCNSKTASSPERFYHLKRIIAAMVQSPSGENETTLFRNRSLAYSLLLELVQNFKVAKPSGSANTHKHLDRLNNILRYINEHYREQLTLAQLAEQEHLSAPYLSSFFEKYMGINFSTHYTNVRLEHAIQDLLYTDIPVEQVALNNGFSDPRAFVRAFKKRHNTLPSTYRKNAPSLQPQKDPLLAINYLDFEPENYFHILSQYLPDSSSAPVHTSEAQARQLLIQTIDCSLPGTPLSHKWRTFIGVGRAKELLYGEVQDMLRRLQRDVGFRYLRFHGIFSDDMLVCRASKDGSLQFSFTLVDKALDFLLSVGLKPLIQFSFMPAALAVNPDKTIFSNPFIISPPRQMEQWNTLVEQFLIHVRSRYGSREIRSWLYSVWNEPDTSIQMFGFPDERQYYELYENTWNTVKAFDRELVFGSPSLYPTTAHEINWMKQFLAYTSDRNCSPQFMDVHYYSDDFEHFHHAQATFTTPAGFSDDPDHFAKYMDRVDAVLRECHAEHLPLYVTEWNLSVSHRNLINDTCFKAAYVAKNFLDNYDRADAIGYWSLTDLIEENQPAPQTFHGGLGLFTQNGIPKPPYYAMALMRRLGDTLLASGDGWFVTRQEDGIIAAMLYNYQHFDPLFLREGLGLTQTSREGVFPSRSNLEVILPLAGLSNGTYRVRETTINRSHGSSYDRWLEMGAPELGSQDCRWLQDNSQPDLHISEAAVSSNEWQYRAILTSHEVRLVELIPTEHGYQS